MIVIDDVFKDYDSVLHSTRALDYKDVVGHDGITYPNIVEPLDHLKPELHDVGVKDINMLFARYSFEGTNPPNWAHCDIDLAPFVGLMSLGFNDRVNTYLVDHKTATDPLLLPDVNDKLESLDTRLADSNDHDKWDTVFTIDYKENSLVLIPTTVWHAASKGFGKDKSDGRLMLVMFCDYMM